MTSLDVSHSSAQQKSSLLGRVVHPLILLAIMWVIRFSDWILPGSFNGFGLRSWDITHIQGILFAPLLHSSWGHLIANTVPFLVCATLVAASGVKKFWFATIVITLVSGIGTWILNSPGALTVGASGLVFGYAGYLVARSLYTPRFTTKLVYIPIAVLVIIIFGGSLVSGLLPIHHGISWQAHVFGALGGVLAASLVYRRERQRA